MPGHCVDGVLQRAPPKHRASMEGMLSSPFDRKSSMDLPSSQFLGATGLCHGALDKTGFGRAGFRMGMPEYTVYCISCISRPRAHTSQASCYVAGSFSVSRLVTGAMAPPK